MNKKIILVVVIAALVVIVSIYFVLKNRIEKVGPLGVLTEATSDWKTYTNREYSFTFKYPNNWLVIENESEGEIVAVTPPVNSANQRINRFSVGVLPSPESDRSTSDYGCKESPWKDVADLYKSDFKLEMTKCISLNEYISLTTSNEEMKVTLEKILSTFKTTSTTNSVTSDWKTYTNSELGYSIKYPANYKITDNNVLASNKFVSAVSLQVSDPVNKAIEFNPVLTVDIIKQPYIVNGKIFVSAKEYANSRYKNLQNLSIVEKVKGDPSIVEVSGMIQSEVSSELLQLKMLVGINNSLIYEVSYYPVDYKYFYEIADTFKFTSSTNIVQGKESVSETPSIKILSPNGGEALKIGQTIKFSLPTTTTQLVNKTFLNSLTYWEDTKKLSEQGYTVDCFSSCPPYEVEYSMNGNIVTVIIPAFITRQGTKISGLTPNFKEEKFETKVNISPGKYQLIFQDANGKQVANSGTFTITN